MYKPDCCLSPHMTVKAQKLIHTSGFTFTQAYAWHKMFGAERHGQVGTMSCPLATCHIILGTVSEAGNYLRQKRQIEPNMRHSQWAQSFLLSVQAHANRDWTQGNGMLLFDCKACQQHTNRQKHKALRLAHQEMGGIGSIQEEQATIAQQNITCRVKSKQVHGTLSTIGRHTWMQMGHM